jgi:hypothetical protein
VTGARPERTVGWSPDRTASKLAGRPPRLEVGDRVRLAGVNITGVVVERAGPLVAVGWLSTTLGPAEVVRTVWDVEPDPVVWSLPPEVVTS